MKFSILKSFAVAGLLTSAIANPIAVRQDSSALTILNDLFTTVQTYTGAINSTLATLTSTSSAVDKAAALTSIGTEFTDLTAAITSATTSIKGLTIDPVSKRSDEIETRQLGELALLGAAISLLLLEVFATIAAAVAALGLAGLLVFLSPLTGALGALILAVEVLVDFLLLDVTVLLDTLLTGLALALGGL
ncbi:uncharacterized protein LY89DRAFT_732094 [Mollisia scopiformis]|uniref:Uncharacterized protein n=1 Tax=Mollisia scopiformis TaxID=149040 RepID=A0A194XEC2_MOLSC|nr:uncharacterized protein LY89DRAFT_732094 [Mollisia scopiformis]KUJ18535.1 hypothetical protein LY89DRAFT_732094 [Mollisia scopiformis]